MILNWFSPLPPARTGIAAYTERILPALHRRAHIILWTDQAEYDSNLKKYAEVRQYQPERIAWAELNRSDMSFYHIGNNRLFHGPIWQISRSHPGIVILHDLYLQNFFAGLYREQWNDRDGYIAQMEECYGPMGRKDAELFWNGILTIDDMVKAYPLTPLAVDNALGVVVHSAHARNNASWKNPCPIVYVPLPYPASHRSPETQRASRVWGGPPYRIVTFGHIGANRQLDALLQAIAGLPERDKFLLDIYGQLWDENHVHRQIQYFGLQKLVRCHGFVAEEELEAALDSSHLGINMRYPTMGEASLSQLQMWDHALPTVVTRVGWYATCPEDAVAFVRPGHEIREVQAHLNALLVNPEQFAKMGERGRRVLEEQHAPEVYAKAVLDIAAQAQRFHPHAAAYQLAKRVGGEMQIWGNNTVPHLAASHLHGQDESFHTQKSVVEKRADKLAPYWAALGQAICEATVAHGERLRRRQQNALEAVRQAVAAHAERLRHAPQNTVEAIRQAVAAHAEQVGELQDVTLQNTPKAPYNREHALRFPLSFNNHDVGFRYLFDLMVVAKSLDLRPGAEVLDFAAGSCYVSELLNRLGYFTVAYDLDADILAIGRERFTLDPRCDPDRTRFVVGDGSCLPFPDESFDGIICMNALHHMPDYRATLAEMWRILRSGGRAVFSEPGAEHSKHPESISMMREFGVLERNVILSEISQLAKAVGFRRMIIKPYVSPEHVELDYEEFTSFKEGTRVSSPYLTSQEIAHFIERFHPLFYLEKGGKRPLTSASAAPELLRARIVIRKCPARARKGERVKVVALCENTGDSLWLSKPRPFGGYVTFGVKLLTSTGRLLDDTRGRQSLSEDVPPGGHIEVVSEVSLEGCEAGRYRLLFDMVNEQVHWFQHKGGAEVAEQWLEIH
jgi:ubiquinone/menaquinone biosynthesis C-methylase UbiE/glycosyltransferase involved in cell wall biosynthesis